MSTAKQGGELFSRELLDEIDKRAYHHRYRPWFTVCFVVSFYSFLLFVEKRISSLFSLKALHSTLWKKQSKHPKKRAIS